MLCHADWFCLSRFIFFLWTDEMKMKISSVHFTLKCSSKMEKKRDNVLTRKHTHLYITSIKGNNKMLIKVINIWKSNQMAYDIDLGLTDYYKSWQSLAILVNFYLNFSVRNVFLKNMKMVWFLMVNFKMHKFNSVTTSRDFYSKSTERSRTGAGWQAGEGAEVKGWREDSKS